LSTSVDKNSEHLYPKIRLSKGITILILTEKPSVAESFALALSIPFDKNLKYYSDGKTEITNCKGHLYELLMPDEYDAKYKIWDFSNLPIIPTTYKYKKNESTRFQTNLVLSLLKKHQNDKIIIATDADREGELISRIVFSEAGLTNTAHCYRFWVSEALTTPVILKGLNNLKPWDEYKELAKKGYARQHADWLVGMNFSPYATLLAGKKATFPVGRVQTAILAAIAQRNNEIKNFVPTPYYQCIAHLKDNAGNTLDALLINPETKKTQFAQINSYIKSAYNYGLTNKQLSITPITTRKKLSPPALLSLTSLQKKAAKLWNYSASTTLEIAQKLYDEYKCTSYPRTPSSVLGDDDVELFQKTFDLLKSKIPYSKYCKPELISSSNKHIFNSKKLDSHHALIPLNFLPTSANDKEKNIYNLITYHFFASCMPDCIYDETKLSIHNGDYNYIATLKKIIEPGWKAAEEDSRKLAPIGANLDSESKDDELKVFDEKTAILKTTEIAKKFTTPKKEFTETSLLAFMENPTMENNEDGKLVGLGTPATRAEILKALIKHEYVIIENKKYYATYKGHFLLKLLFKNPLTAKIAGINNTTQWEKQLDADPISFEKSITDYVKEAVSTHPEIENYERESLGNCPLCGNKILESQSNFFCVGYKNNPPCSFAIWKTICTAKITTMDAKLLLEGKTTKTKKMKNKEGKEFSAKLKLNNDKIEFVFEKKKKYAAKR